MSRPDRLSIKFLVNNGLAGTLIGKEGAAIKELIEISGARISVSSVSDVYPGTSDRVVLIAGSLECVDSAQGLVWEMIASNTVSKGDKSVTWSPRAALEAQGQYDDLEISAKITIPAAAGGVVLGRGGSNLRAIADDSGARVQMSGKDEAIFTQERVLTITGNSDSCSKCVSGVLAKLAEDLVVAQYVNHGVAYSTHISSLMGGFYPGQEQRYRGSRGAAASVAATAADVSANSSIVVAVPDALIGNILGRGGVTLREIQSLSGAKLSVSARGTFAEGTTNRLVTITGTPAAAQTAHILVSQKLQQQSSAPPRTRRPKSDTA